MINMPDAVRAAIEFMQADGGRLVHRSGYNITAMSFAPEDPAREIARRIPHFTIGYTVDPVRRAIADSWPRHMDDSAAREEWGWQSEYDRAATVEAMLSALRGG